MLRGSRDATSCPRATGSNPQAHSMQASARSFVAMLISVSPARSLRHLFDPDPPILELRGFRLEPDAALLLDGERLLKHLAIARALGDIRVDLHLDRIPAAQIG